MTTYSPHIRNYVCVVGMIDIVVFQEHILYGCCLNSVRMAHINLVSLEKYTSLRVHVGFMKSRVIYIILIHALKYKHLLF